MNAAPGWLTEESRQEGEVVFDHREYAYDTAGNRTGAWKDGVQTESNSYDGSFLTAVNSGTVSWDKDVIAEDGAGRTILHDAAGAETGLDVPSGPSYRFGRDPWGRPAWTDNGTDTRDQVWGNPGGVWPVGSKDTSGVNTLNVALDGVLLGVVQGGSFVPASSDPAGNVAFVGSEWLSLPDAFGRDTEGVSMTAFPHVFAGLELLPESGGYQLSQSRLYDGSVGRFARMDPLGVQGGPSRFTYAENDPTSLWDPAGLSAEGCGQAQLPRPMGGEPTEGVQKIEGAGLYYHSLHESVPPADVVQAYLEGMFATLDRQAESRRRGPAPIGAPTALGVVGGRVANPEDATRRLAPGAGAQDSDSSDAEDEKDATYGGSGEVVVEWVPSDEPAAADEPVDDSPILPQHSALVGKGAERRSPLGVRPDGVRRNGWGATESFTRQLAQETSALAERQEAAPGSDASTWTRMSYAISRGTSRTRIGIQAVGFAVRHPELSVPALIEHTPLGTGVEEVAESLAEGDSLAEALVSGVVVGQTDGLLTCAGGMKAVADSTTNVTLSALQVPLTGTASTAYVLTGEVYGPYADAGALIDEHVDLSPDATTVLSTALRPAMASRGGARPRYVPRVPNGEPLPLPSGPNRELAPSSMDPHTQIGWREGRNGGYVQTREFWPNGEPVKQVDCTDHGRPGRRTDPHVHAYSPNPTGGSPQLGPARPPELGEL